MAPVDDAVKRRFTVDNPDIVWADEDESGGQGGQDDSEAPKKRKKTNRSVGGRVPKGKDFWTLFDAFMDSKVKENGRKISDHAWKSYLSLLAHDDDAGFLGRMTASVAKKRKVVGSSGHSDFMATVM
ncbi:hypothetical protein Moror_8470 [Moniliophthora roreri MCA 2997]|uniref:Uncharacterized protein n=1 Tax=Moniliophthora roreri (strain MCA 2997) TaxID=1381753 RepID=V2XP76_MONRO|nr:hypothetical protein Moror_8470 [Moniliophthora roreri MCA 2997]